MTARETVAVRPRRGGRLTGSRRIALAAFAFGSALVAVLLALPDQARSVVPGHMVPGHESFACTRCHVAAPGTMRQQVQANVLHWAGLRRTGASFGHEPVSSAICGGCHAREDDRHPSFRFREPRFTAVSRTLDARSCLTCHAEHAGRRVSNDGLFCAACHDGMTARRDPIQPSHAALSQAKRWDSCLTCHDFHGNHPVKAPHRFEEARDLRAVRAYLADGPDPYSPRKTRPARDPAGLREAEARVP